MEGPEDQGICQFPGFGACGLANLGNTCYANAALQCLSYMPLMRGYMLGRQFSGDINRDNPLGTGGVLLEGYAELMSMLWMGKKGYLVPVEFRRILGKCKNQFATNEQQDAQEVSFMCFSFERFRLTRFFGAASCRDPGHAARRREQGEEEAHGAAHRGRVDGQQHAAADRTRGVAEVRPVPMHKCGERAHPTNTS